MKSSVPKLTSNEIEDETHRLLGRFFTVFAKIEFNLALLVGPEGNFHDKLQGFLNTANVRLDDSHPQFCEVMAWYKAADSVREIRNRFAHGRWTFHAPTQRVIHVLGYPPARQDEKRYSLMELQAIVRAAESVNIELCKHIEILI